jgi:hypothetical protein
MIMTVLLLCEGAINVAMLLPSSSMLYVGIGGGGFNDMDTPQLHTQLGG